MLLLQLMRRTSTSPLLPPPFLDAFLNGKALATFSLCKTIHTSWNLHQQTSRAILSPASKSSRQIIHSASLPSSSVQSFSVAMYGNMPRAAWLMRFWLLAPSPFPPALLMPRVRWVGRLADVVRVRTVAGAGEAECRAMHSSICCVRAESSFAGPVGGSSSPQMGHSSSSAIWRRGRDGCG